MYNYDPKAPQRADHALALAKLYINGVGADTKAEILPAGVTFWIVQDKNGERKIDLQQLSYYAMGYDAPGDTLLVSPITIPD